MEIVSFETAKKLKGNGFPQPESNFGQFWYSEDGTVFIVIETFTHPLAHYAWINQRGRDRVVIENAIFNKMYFAPTATDILRQTPDFAIAFVESNAPNCFICYHAFRHFAEQHPFSHENAAEAAALAWISLNSVTVDIKINGDLNNILEGE